MLVHIGWCHIHPALHLPHAAVHAQLVLAAGTQLVHRMVSPQGVTSVLQQTFQLKMLM